MDELMAWTVAMTWTEIPTPTSELAALRETERQARRLVQHEMNMVTWAARRRAWRHRSGMLIYPMLAAVVATLVATLGPAITVAIYCVVVLTCFRPLGALLIFPTYDIDNDIAKLREAREAYGSAFDALVAFEIAQDPALVWPERFPVSIEESA